MRRTSAVQQAFDEARFGATRSLNVREPMLSAAEAARRAEGWLRAKQVEQIRIRRRRVINRAEARDNLAAQSRAMQEVETHAFQNVATRAEAIAALSRKGGQGFIDPTLCHPSPAPTA